MLVRSKKIQRNLKASERVICKVTEVSLECLLLPKRLKNIHHPRAVTLIFNNTSNTKLMKLQKEDEERFLCQSVGKIKSVLTVNRQSDKMQ